MTVPDAAVAATPGTIVGHGILNEESEAEAEEPEAILEGIPAPAGRAVAGQPG